MIGGGIPIAHFIKGKVRNIMCHVSVFICIIINELSMTRQHNLNSPHEMLKKTHKVISKKHTHMCVCVLKHIYLFIVMNPKDNCIWQ